MSRAVNGADRMREMIEGLLQYSRVETCGETFEPVALDGVLKDVREYLQLQIAKSGAGITADSLPTVLGDRSQLRQFLQNLLDNAIEYSGDHPPVLRMDRDARSGVGRCHFHCRRVPHRSRFHSAGVRDRRPHGSRYPVFRPGSNVLRVRWCALLSLDRLVISYGVFPSGIREGPYAVLVTLGLTSGGIVSAQLGVGLVIQRLQGVTGERTAFKIYEAVAAVLGLIGMVWAVINIHERAARYGVITIGGTLGFVLNLLGIELPLPWIIADGIDAALGLYVGAILIGFHTLETLHKTWRASKATAAAGVSGAKTDAKKASAIASEQYDRLLDE